MAQSFLQNLQAASIVRLMADNRGAIITSAGLLTLLGLLAASAPAFLAMGNDVLDGTVLFLSIAGLVSSAVFLSGRFARGWISGIALGLVGPPLYAFAVLVTINIAMRLTGSA